MLIIQIVCNHPVATDRLSSKDCVFISTVTVNSTAASAGDSIMKTVTVSSTAASACDSILKTVTVTPQLFWNVIQY